MNQPTIKAIYNGMQEGAEPFELWTILAPLGDDHPMLSSVSRRTIDRHGYTPEAVSPLAFTHNVQC